MTTPTHRVCFPWEESPTGYRRIPHPDPNGLWVGRVFKKEYGAVCGSWHCLGGEGIQNGRCVTDQDGMDRVDELLRDAGWELE